MSQKNLGIDLYSRLNLKEQIFLKIDKANEKILIIRKIGSLLPRALFRTLINFFKVALGIWKYHL